MNLDEARELKETLEAIEASMERIKALWLSDEFPSEEALSDLSHAARSIADSMESIKEKAEELPTADSLEDLDKAVGRISATVAEIVEKAEELPTADELSV